MGSPPHGRGKVMKANKKVKENGITPAWAGKSRECRYALTNEWDHPRVGGEKQMERQAGRLWVGSPPRGRGKARGPRFFDVVGGITPAWAGKSRPAAAAKPFLRDHPRVGGEKHPGHRCAGGLNGITPAWAGKRMQVSPKPTLPQDHPRVDGEKILEPSMGVGNFGSPPRGRGKAVKFRCTCGLQRITPALAGKSCRP